MTALYPIKMIDVFKVNLQFLWLIKVSCIVKSFFSKGTLEWSVFEKMRFSTRTVFTEACGRQARQQEKSPLSTKTDTCERGFKIAKKFVPFYCGLFS